MNMVLSQLNMSPEKAKHVLLRMLGDEDDTAGTVRALTTTELESLLPCLPTLEERHLLGCFQGSWVNLSPCERFMLSVLRIPALHARLKTAIFLNDFDSRAGTTIAAAVSVTTACKEIRNSSLLQSALKTALAIANFLNVDNLNGAGAGFHVEGLLKLRDIKSKRERTPTLLHFLARDLARHHADGASLAAELHTCKEAARVSLGDLHSELDSLAEGVETSHQAGHDAGADSEQLEEFLNAATDRLVAVNAAVVEADSEFMGLRSIVNGETSTMDEPAAFFTLMSTFCRQLDTAHAENAAADKAAGKRSSNGKGAQPGSAPARRGYHSPGDSSGAPGQSSGSREQAKRNDTPPKEKRDRVLETIRAYSRLTASQRKRLLTDKEAKARFDELAKVDKFPTDVLVNSAGVDMGGTSKATVAATPAGSDQLAGTALRSSGTGSLASLLAPRSSAGGSKRTNNGAGASMGGSSCSPSEGASTCSSGAVSLPLEDEVASKGNSGNNQRELSAAAISSPVARMLASSRQLVQSIASRPNELLERGGEDDDNYSDYSEEDDFGSEYSDEYSSDYSDSSHEDLSVRSMGPGAEDQGPRNGGSTFPGTSVHHEDKVASPVTFRPLSASADGILPHEETPQVSWAKKSVGGALQRGSMAAEPSSPGGTPEDAFLQCTASLQPLPGGPQWRDPQRYDHRASGAAGAHPRYAVPALSNASQALSDRNPMGSAAATSLQYGYHGSTGQYNKALQDDAASPQKQGDHRHHNRSSSSAWESHSTAAPQAQLRASDDGGVRNSKRVSFSLPNSPREAPRRGASAPVASPGVDLQKLAELEAAYDDDAGYFSEDYEDEYYTGVNEFENEGFIESPVNLRPLEGEDEEDQQQRELRGEEPRHHRVRAQKPIALHRDYDEQKALRQEPSTRGRQRSSSVGGVDLSMAKELVKKATQVRRSRERQEAAYMSGGTAQRSGDYYRTPENGTAGWGNYNDGEYTPDSYGEGISPQYSDYSAESLPEEGPRAQVARGAATATAGAMPNNHPLASQMRESLPKIPGVSSDKLPGLPLTQDRNSAPGQFDGFMAAVISNAGNTPTGPLARGVRQGDSHLFDDAAAGVLRAAAARRAAEVAGIRPGQTNKALLEPIVPAPLGMGVRVSETVASGISPNTLKTSLEAHLHQMQQTRSDTGGHPGGVRASVASVRAPANTAVDASAASLQYAGQYNDLSRSQVNESVPSGPKGPVFAVEQLGLGATKKSKIKSGSVRDVNSALAQERMARWDALQRGY